MVTILPNILLPVAGSEADVIITILDNYGNPAKARVDVNVAISSSNLQVADISNKNIIISKGSISGKTKIVSTGQLGTSMITSSSINLKSDSEQLSVVGPKPEKLYIWSPQYHLEGEDGYVFVGIVDNNMKLLN